MWFFSGKGDQGNTRLFDGQERAKSDTVFELIGALDEATACLGLSISFCADGEMKADLAEIQDMLSKFMGLIAGAGSAVIAGRFNLDEAIGWTEERIKYYGQGLANPSAFIYAGKSSLGAAIDLARTVIRRSERIGVRFSQEYPDFDRTFLVLLNRLSSFFFILRLYTDEEK
jgi:cob(I)alamin adenosyltransferase